MNFRILLLVFIVFPFMPLLANAQSNQKEEAITLFEKGKYTEALIKFRKLLTLFPKDPFYQYYAGVCMVQTSNSLTHAAEYLKFASENAVPADAFFFLGRAYHLQYKFNEALEAYRNFKDKGKRAEKDRLQCDMYIGMAENGLKLISRQTQLKVYRIDTVAANDLFNFYNKRLTTGKFEENTDRALPFLEGKLRNNWRFVPDGVNDNSVIFETVSGISRNNLELARISKTPLGDWGRPENLSAIVNSPYDEDYGYYSSDKQMLWFASKGHNSMGGYDIFKSGYDTITKKWSEPVNLGYPINTPYDDFLFVPADGQSQASFVSNRGVSGDRLVVYTIAYANDYTSEEIPADTDFQSKAKLTVNDKVLPTLAKPVIAKKPQSLSKKDTTPYANQLVNHKDYNSLLNSALKLQLQSDSLNREADDLRQQAAKAKTDTEKERMNKDAYSLEKRAKATQIKADALYEKARKYEVMYSAKKDSAIKISDEMMRKALVNKPKGTDVAPKTVSKNIGEPKKKDKNVLKAAPKVIYDFRIMAKSPYAKPTDIPLNKPLPEGLVYRVQMGAFSKPVVPDRFRGIVPISGDTVPNSPMIKYFAGLFSRMSDAEKALNKIREYGYKDAYLVAFFDGKNIPSNRAKEIETENNL